MVISTYKNPRFDLGMHAYFDSLQVYMFLEHIVYLILLVYEHLLTRFYFLLVQLELNSQRIIR